MHCELELHFKQLPEHSEQALVPVSKKYLLLQVHFPVAESRSAFCSHVVQVSALEHTSHAYPQLTHSSPLIACLSAHLRHIVLPKVNPVGHVSHLDPSDEHVVQDE